MLEERTSARSEALNMVEKIQIEEISAGEQQLRSFCRCETALHLSAQRALTAAAFAAVAAALAFR